MGRDGAVNFGVEVVFRGCVDVGWNTEHVPGIEERERETGFVYPC